VCLNTGLLQSRGMRHCNSPERAHVDEIGKIQPRGIIAVIMLGTLILFKPQQRRGLPFRKPPSDALLLLFVNSNQ